jgi:hypothetical protein
MAVEFDLQAAVYSKLVAASIGATVYDVVPQSSDGASNAAFPCVAVGRIILSQYDTQTTVGYAAQMTVHTYSRTGSMKECKEVQGAIFAALHRQALTIAGHNNFSLLRESSDCMDEEDGKIHGVCEYRALIEESA